MFTPRGTGSTGAALLADRRVNALVAFLERR
jgi:hypothetical protein